MPNWLKILIVNFKSQWLMDRRLPEGKNKKYVLSASCFSKFLINAT